MTSCPTLEHLALLGRFDDALRESERARELDPSSLIIATDNGQFLYYSRQYDRAIEKLRAVLEMDPNFSHAHILAYAYVQKGMFVEAQADVEKFRRIEDNPWDPRGIGLCVWPLWPTTGSSARVR